MIYECFQKQISCHDLIPNSRIIIPYIIPVTLKVLPREVYHNFQAQVVQTSKTSADEILELRARTVFYAT